MLWISAGEENVFRSEDDGNGLTHDFILGQNYVYGYHGPPFDVRYSDFF